MFESALHFLVLAKKVNSIFIFKTGSRRAALTILTEYLIRALKYR